MDLVAGRYKQSPSLGGYLSGFLYKAYESLLCNFQNVAQSVPSAHGLQNETTDKVGKSYFWESSKKLEKNSNCENRVSFNCPSTFRNFIDLYLSQIVQDASLPTFHWT